MRTAIVTSVIVLMFGCLALSPGAQAQTPPKFWICQGDGTEIPPEWAGIWETVATEYECGSEDPVQTFSYQDTICTGSVVQDPESDYEITCTNTIDENTITIHCEATMEFDSCIMQFTIDATTVREGETIQSTSTMVTHFEGEDCLDIPDQCIHWEETSTRIGPEPDPCDFTPVEPEAWGGIKNLFR